MGVIRRGDDSKLALKLLQTEDARAVKALHATQSLTTLHLSAEMTRLNPLLGLLSYHALSLVATRTTPTDSLFCETDLFNAD